MSDVVKSGLAPSQGEGNVVHKPMGNTAQVELFTTSATFSLPIKKEQQSIKILLDSKNVNYVEYDVASDQAKGDEMRSRSGQRKLPQLFINGEFIGGYDEALYLEEIGELSKKLGSS